jgi:hypothetical protein
LRYVLFAYGATEQAVWMLFAGIALHGICYDFFFVTGFMYADRVAPPALRGQTQSMLVFFTQGVGMFVGFKVAAAKFAPVAESSTALGSAITAAKAEEKLSFFQQMGRMFSVNMPESVDASFISQSAQLWKQYWLFPAGMAAVIAVIFFVAFWDKSAEKDS